MKKLYQRITTCMLCIAVTTVYGQKTDDYKRLLNEQVLKKIQFAWTNNPSKEDLNAVLDEISQNGQLKKWIEEQTAGSKKMITTITAKRGAELKYTPTIPYEKPNPQLFPSAALIEEIPAPVASLPEALHTNIEQRYEDITSRTTAFYNKITPHLTQHFQSAQTSQVDDKGPASPAQKSNESIANQVYDTYMKYTLEDIEDRQITGTIEAEIKSLNTKIIAWSRAADTFSLEPEVKKALNKEVAPYKLARAVLLRMVNAREMELRAYAWDREKAVLLHKMLRLSDLVAKYDWKQPAMQTVELDPPAKRVVERVVLFSGQINNLISYGRSITVLAQSAEDTYQRQVNMITK